MARKRASAEEKENKVAEILALTSKGMTIGDACERAGVSRANFMNWRKKFGAGSPSRRGEGQLLNVRVQGTTDMMFIGFGRSQDVLTAIHGLASMFSGGRSAPGPRARA